MTHHIDYDAVGRFNGFTPARLGLDPADARLPNLDGHRFDSERPENNPLLVIESPPNMLRSYRYERDDGPVLNVRTAQPLHVFFAPGFPAIDAYRDGDAGDLFFYIEAVLVLSQHYVDLAEASPQMQSPGHLLVRARSIERCLHWTLHPELRPALADPPRPYQSRRVAGLPQAETLRKARIEAETAMRVRSAVEDQYHDANRTQR